MVEEYTDDDGKSEATAAIQSQSPAAHDSSEHLLHVGDTNVVLIGLSITPGVAIPSN